MISKVLTTTRATVQNCGIIYKAVAQTVPIYGRKSLVVTGAMLKVLEDFHHWAARCITGMTSQRAEEGEWEYPQVADYMEAAGLWMTKE